MTLYELIQSIPAAKSFADNGNDAACTDLLNKKTQRGLVPIVEIVQWSFLNGIAPIINAHSVNIESPLYGVCYTANAYFNNTRFTNIDLDLPQVEAMLQGLIQGSIITEEQYQDIYNLANNRVSVAFVNLGKDVSLFEVSEAMLVNRPNGVIQWQ